MAEESENDFIDLSDNNSQDGKTSGDSYQWFNWLNDDDFSQKEGDSFSLVNNSIKWIVNPFIMILHFQGFLLAMLQ